MEVKEPESYVHRYGCWGICFTYGTWFAVEGLVTYGKNYNNCPSIRKACDFLLSKQLPDGGWGESYLSSQNKVKKNFTLVTDNSKTFSNKICTICSTTKITYSIIVSFFFFFYIR